MAIFDSDVPSTVPLWTIGTEGARLERPTEYYTQCKKFLQDNASKGIVGFITKNQWGQKRFMPAIVFFRMKDQFDAGKIEIVDVYRNHNVAMEVGFEGFDTEGAQFVA